MSSTDNLQPYNIPLPEPKPVHVSITQGNRAVVHGTYSADAVRAILADAHAHYEAQVRQLGGLARPDADAPPAQTVEGSKS